MHFFKSALIALPLVASLVAALPAVGANTAAVEKRDLQSGEVKNILADLDVEIVSRLVRTVF